MSGGRAHGNYVDYSVHSICAPHRASRPPSNFDTLDILQWHVLHIPIDSREGGAIDRAAVNQHQHFVRILTAESSNADGPLIRVDARDVDAGDHTKKVGDVG